MSAESDVSSSPATVAQNLSLSKLLGQCGLLDEDWMLEAELRGVERLVRSLNATSSLPEPAAMHGVHDSPAAWHAAPQAPPPEVKPAAIEPPKGSAAAWLALSLGLAVFACGAVLLGWSLAAAREDLWPLGMPLVLIGQAGLIVGLILQLDSLWQTSRQTAAALSDLDGELGRVRHATTLLSSSKSTGAQSFHSHLASGASPQLLLTDLKGQLDLLAQQMAVQRR